jgi:senataxin
LQSGYKKQMLTVQYRMHPLIRYFPSRQFYENRITDGDCIKTRKLTPDLVKIHDAMRRVCFFDLTASSETVSDRSKYNPSEVHFTLTLIKTLAQICGTH